MKTAIAFALSSVLFTACGDDPTENFLGTYKATVTLQGQSSQTFPDTIGISEGDSADLIMSSQQLGALKVSIIGDTSFEIDAQQITAVDPASGQVVTLNIQGQGTVSDGVLAASGQLSALASTFGLTMNGQRQ
jgi:hypothetical protein